MEYVRFLCVVGCIGWTGGCGYPRPPRIGDADAGNDGGPGCAANQALRCDGSSVVRCNADGTAELVESCTLGCRVAGLRCNDVDPANNLAPYLDLAAGEPDLDLGLTATINTEDGTVMVGGSAVVVKSVTVVQTAAPAIRVYMVRSLTAGNVTVISNLPTASRAIAIVSHGDVKINGVFTASANQTFPGAGGFNDATCVGSSGDTISGGAAGGAGGGGFGLGGGRGGSATTDNGSASGGAGGTATGNPGLIPLRGGCDSGTVGGAKGAGGGAIQLVSRTRITVPGIVAANGSSVAGGGSGGGILLEAPVVDVSGSVVANGGAGAGGCVLPQPGEDGRLDATPATGGRGCGTSGVDGGNGGARNAGAGNGASINLAGTGLNSAFGGHGGGGVGRIRVNTAPGGLHATGVFSPNPSTGTLAR